MERREVSANRKWKTADVFKDDQTWVSHIKSLEKRLDFARFKGTLNNAESVLAYLRAADAFEEELVALYLYAHLKHDEDVRETKYQAYLARVNTLFSKMGAEVAFAIPELTSQSEETLREIASDPRLKDYDYILTRLIEEKEHVLSEEEEKILAQAGDIIGTSQDVFTILNNAEMGMPKITVDGEKKILSHGLYSSILSCHDRRLRARAFKRYYAAYRAIITTLSTAYYGNVKGDIFLKDTRKFNSCLEMALFQEDVSRDVYDNLIRSVNAHTSILHRYMRLRKKLLGYREMHMYDLHVSLVENAELNLTYDEAFDLVEEGLSPLGEEYHNLLEKGRTEGWIDVYETVGKRSGAYSACAFGIHPYVLLNYQQTTHDVFTIAHEMGHALHSYFSGNSQPYSKSDYKIFVAEVASTVNEVLLLKYLKEHTTDPKLKRYLLNYYLDMLRTTLFRQTQFAEFEERAHEMAEAGEPLHKDNLSALYYELNQKYYGDAVVHDREIEIEWARIPHFYTAFYVYKYATGIVAAVTIANKILKEGEPAVKDYMAFLSAGSKTDPVSLLKIAGADLTTDAPFEIAMKEFSDTLDEFEAMSKQK
jgi:oligoendopeptidase F